MSLTRTRLALLPTPVAEARGVRAALGCAPLWIKRDDLTGFGVAGNKARALEFLVGDAVARGCDVLVTGGGPDSNFVAAAALAARVAGMDCELVVATAECAATSPNIALARAAGARIVASGEGRRDLVDAAVEERAAQLRADGRHPVALPRGGSTALGAVGFARAVSELTDQVATGRLPEPALVVIAVGSGGSAAGLLAGAAAVAAGWRLLAVSVSRPRDEIEATVRSLADGCAELCGTPEPDASRLEIVDARGPGFGVASARDRAAAEFALHTEGLLLDDTYGAKAFAVALDRLRGGEPGPVLYWHTGGVSSALAHLVPEPVRIPAPAGPADPEGARR
ncbi:1-aminocyclopropane-1-carboxylate deaminase/D-cysteine desulfhydrase [Pseudonocardia endophytica]|uniref:D-cysteine desulfhydrase n=1 Tax=Pseudonocardia endophytica TaxID=401976 RepID=A0A4R1HUV1_PSEEN|nr:pyridoxal-phosphate dependent enzyme [Pseudonocardia endophytica]TCK24440.1 D-cysteine desulfhydrase [Pseudonocardia endophytica]